MYEMTARKLAIAFFLVATLKGAAAFAGPAGAAVRCVISASTRSTLTRHLLGTHGRRINASGEVSGSHTAPAFNDLLADRTIGPHPDPARASPRLMGTATVNGETVRIYEFLYCNPPDNPVSPCRPLRKTLLARGELAFDSARGLITEGGTATRGAASSGLDSVAGQLITDGYTAPQTAILNNLGTARSSLTPASRIPREGQQLMGPGRVRLFNNGWVEFDVAYPDQVVRMRARVDERTLMSGTTQIDFGTMFPIGARVP